jgi:hypothetical protein
MAIGWISALKIIPWGDVIEAAPVIAKTARRIFTKSEQASQEASVQEAPPTGADALVRLQHLEQRVAQMAQQQQASAELIESLAAQNAQVVQAIDVLRVRTRLLIGAVLVLLVGWGATALWWSQR